MRRPSFSLSLSTSLPSPTRRKRRLEVAVEAAVPAPPIDVPVITFRQVQEVPLANVESIEVDGTVQCALDASVLRCTARREVAE